jgi:putative oxidoreductase
VSAPGRKRKVCVGWGGRCFACGGRGDLGLAQRRSEFGGGVLSLLGLVNPLGPLGVIGAMATRKAHWGKPIWVTEGGPELPVTNISIATALLVAGPGKYSLDRVLGIRLPRWVTFVGLVVIVITVYFGAKMEPPQRESGEEAREELQAEDEDQQQT